MPDIVTGISDVPGMFTLFLVDFGISGTWWDIFGRIKVSSGTCPVSAVSAVLVLSALWPEVTLNLSGIRTLCQNIMLLCTFPCFRALSHAFRHFPCFPMLFPMIPPNQVAVNDGILGFLHVPGIFTLFLVIFQESGCRLSCFW